MTTITVVCTSFFGLPFKMNWKRSHTAQHTASINSPFDRKTSKRLKLFPEVIQNFLRNKSYKQAFISSVVII
jgi:hypothetical protein